MAWVSLYAHSQASCQRRRLWQVLFYQEINKASIVYFQGSRLSTLKHFIIKTIKSVLLFTTVVAISGSFWFAPVIAAESTTTGGTAVSNTAVPPVDTAEKIPITQVSLTLKAKTVYKVVKGKNLTIVHDLTWSASSKKPTTDGAKFKITTPTLPSGLALKGFWVGISKIDGSGKPISSSTDTGSCEKEGCGNYLAAAAEGWGWNGYSQLGTAKESETTKHQFTILASGTMLASSTAPDANGLIKSVQTSLVPVLRLDNNYDYLTASTGTIPITIEVYDKIENLTKSCKSAVQDGAYCAEGSESTVTGTPYESKEAGNECGVSSGDGLVNCAKKVVNGIIGSLVSIVADVIQIIFTIIQYILYQVLSLIVVKMILAILSIRTYTDTFVGLATPGVRLFTGLSSVIFVLAMLAAGLQRIVGEAGFNFQRITVTKVIVGAVLINFSTAFFQAIMGVAEWFLFLVFPNSQAAIDAVLYNLIVSSQTKNAFSILNGQTTGQAFGDLVSVFLSLVVSIMVTYVFVKVLWYVFKRLFTSLVVVMIFPLYFVAMAIPAMKPVQSLITKQLKENIIFLPILVLFLNLAGNLSTSLGPAMQALYTGSKWESTLGSEFSKFIVVVLPNLILLGVISQGMKLAKSASSANIDFRAADKFAAGDFKGGFKGVGADYMKAENSTLGKMTIKGRNFAPGTLATGVKSELDKRKSELNRKVDKRVESRQIAARTAFETGDVRGQVMNDPSYLFGRGLPFGKRSMYMRGFKNWKNKRFGGKEKEDAIEDKSKMLADLDRDALAEKHADALKSKEALEQRATNIQAISPLVHKDNAEMLSTQIEAQINILREQGKSLSGDAKTKNEDEVNKLKNLNSNVRDKSKYSDITGNQDLGDSFRDLDADIKKNLRDRTSAVLDNAVRDAKEAEKKLDDQVKEQVRLRKAHGFENREVTQAEYDKNQDAFTQVQKARLDRKSPESAMYASYLKMDESEAEKALNAEALGEVNYVNTQLRQAIQAKDKAKIRVLLRKANQKGIMGDLLEKNGFDRSAEGARKFYEKNKENLGMGDKALRTYIKEVGSDSIKANQPMFGNLVSVNPAGDLDWNVKETLDSSGKPVNPGTYDNTTAHDAGLRKTYEKMSYSDMLSSSESGLITKVEEKDANGQGTGVIRTEIHAEALAALNTKKAQTPRELERIKGSVSKATARALKNSKNYGSLDSQTRSLIESLII